MGVSQSVDQRRSRRSGPGGGVRHWMRGVPDSWQVIGTYSWRKWHLKRRSLVWGFADHINLSGFEYGDLVQPWSTEGRHFMAYVYCKARDAYHPESFVPCGATSKNKGEGELMFAVERPYKQDAAWYPVNLPPGYKLDSLLTSTIHGQRYYTGVNVIGARSDYVVIQVTRKSPIRVDILVTRRSGQVLEVVGLHRVGTLPGPYVMEALLSPSCTKLLLQPSAYYCVRFGNKPKTAEIQLVDIPPNGQCTLVGPLMTITSDEASRASAGVRRDHVFAFDPRYDWRRIVIGYQYASVVRVYDLLEKKILAENNSHGSLKQCAENLVYSPDGRFLASLVSTILTTRTKIRIWGVLVYCSDTLELIHGIDQSCPTGPLETLLYPACIFPMFSSSGKFLAVPRRPKYHNSESFVVDVDVLLVPNVIHLQTLCRITILLCTKSNDVPLLPLPSALKNYLLFKPYLG